MYSAGLELTKLTYTKLEDNLIRHRDDRLRLQTYTRYDIPVEVPPDAITDVRRLEMPIKYCLK